MVHRFTKIQNLWTLPRGSLNPPVIISYKRQNVLKQKTQFIDFFPSFNSDIVQLTLRQTKTCKLDVVSSPTDYGTMANITSRSRWGRGKGLAQDGFTSRYWLHCQWLSSLFLEFHVLITKIKNLKWQFGENINFVTFGKFIKLWVKVLTTNQFVYLISYKFLDQQCFPKVTKLISSLNCHFRYLMFVIKIVKTWNLSDNVVSTLNWIWHVPRCQDALICGQMPGVLLGQLEFGEIPPETSLHGLHTCQILDPSVVNIHLFVQLLCKAS